jgi:hypothetical protein
VLDDGWALAVKGRSLVSRTRRPWLRWLTDNRAGAVLIALVACVTFLSTLQMHINGSPSPYATDVGELQNALPRWGTIHYSGYPLYTLLGSLFVTALREVGIAPAAGASLFSVVWEALALGLLGLLAIELGAPRTTAALSALVVAVSTSTWIDASLAEIHTLTMFFTAATLLLALRFRRSGRRDHWLWLTLAFTQGIAHQRSVAFLAPAVLLLIWPQLSAVRRNFWPALGVALLAPLTYLYLPLRYWQGATWTFGQPGTWEGFWKLVLDTKADRIVALPESLGAWLTRAGTAARLLSDDLPLAVLAAGLLGLAAPLGPARSEPVEGLGTGRVMRGQRVVTVALLLVVLPYLGLSVLIWEARVSDALLAVKLPVVHLAGVGLALLAAALVKHAAAWRPGESRLQVAANLVLGVILVGLFVLHRPRVLAVTRDRSVESAIATVARVTPPAEPTTFFEPWGRDFWALTYAQAYRGELPGLNLVDHNANFEALIARGDRLLVRETTFYAWPLAWWEERLGTAYLSSAAPEVIEVAPAPPVARGDVPAGPSLELGNNVRILAAQLHRPTEQELILTVYWETLAPLELDYSVAVHLVSHNPPRGPGDILAQAGRRHPVSGWYPTSLWEAGEVIRDDYPIPVPDAAHPAAVRVAMYRVGADGGFINTRWLALPIPAAAY